MDRKDKIIIRVMASWFIGAPLVSLAGVGITKQITGDGADPPIAIGLFILWALSLIVALVGMFDMVGR